MKIAWSKHALLKLKQRGLDKLKVLETVVNPDFTEPTYSSRENRYKLYTKNHLKVVVIVESKKVTIVTAHWVAKHMTK